MWGSDPCFRYRSSPTHSPFFPLPLSSVLLSFASFFSGGEVLLPALSWCSAGSSVSGGIFLIHSWREMNSTSTYSSAILDLYRIVFEYTSIGFPNFQSHGRQIRSKISTVRESSGGEKMLSYSHVFLITWRLYSPLTFLKAE